ncbi:MAG: fatty acid desaturase [Pseudomonadota bacterium]
MAHAPTNISTLRAAVPEQCFDVNAFKSIAYLVFDLCLIAACYGVLSQVSVWYIEWPLIFLIGTLLWSIFVLGHDAGHGVFVRSRIGNTIWGTLMHGALLVPFRAWQRSHALHHANTGHLDKEEVFRACRKPQDRWFRKVLFRSGIFLGLGWPMYKLGFRNIGTYSPIKGSHFLPTSTLMAPHIRGSWYAGLIVALLFGGAYVGLAMIYGWGFFAKYILAPYLIYGAWLTFVTWMQHVSEDVPVYQADDWTFLKGSLCSVDRNYGAFNWLTHNTGNYHVIHHLFPTIPHYHLKGATEAVRPLLGETYLRSDRFVLFDFVRSMLNCHHVVSADGRETYRSEYPFSRTYERAEINDTVSAQ